MTIISSLNADLLSSLTPSLRATNGQSSTTASDTDAFLGSTIVTIPSPVNETPLVYTMGGTLQGAEAIWGNSSTDTDAISAVMASDYRTATMTGQFANLGSALLARFSTTGSDYSQSVTATAANAGAELALRGEGTQADVQLTVKTASGNTVNIELDSNDGTLAVSIKSSGTLSDTERSAIAKLATGFQQAISGLTTSSLDPGDPTDSSPTLNLSGLMQYDPSVLSSVSLKVNVTGDGSNDVSADVELNNSTKSVKLTDSDGTVNLSVDSSSDSAILGTTAQQNQAIGSYLRQFDNANSEGHGNTGLMTLFKDAFTQLNSTDGTSTQQVPGTAGTPWLAQADQAMLTGLPDFTASITDNSVSSNPLLPDQTDSFSYQVSQTTNTGSDLTGSRVTQTQQSLLKASYHTSLSGGAVKLTPLSSSQTYDYAQVDAAASSTVSLQNQGGKLLDATLNQTSSDSTDVSEYVKGKLVSDVTTPKNTSNSKDLLSLLKPLIDDYQAQENTGAWQQTLSNIHSMILLNAPTQPIMQT